MGLSEENIFLSLFYFCKILFFYILNLEADSRHALFFTVIQHFQKTLLCFSSIQFYKPFNFSIQILKNYFIIRSPTWRQGMSNNYTSSIVVMSSLVSQSGQYHCAANPGQSQHVTVHVHHGEYQLSLAFTVFWNFEGNVYFHV